MFNKIFSQAFVMFNVVACIAIALMATPPAG